MIDLGFDTWVHKRIRLLGIDAPETRTKDLQEKAIKNIKNNGGKVWGTFVLGLPYQKEKDIQECLNYAKQLKIDYPIPNTVTPLPGSAFYEELKSKDLLIEKNFDKYNYYTLVFKHEFFTTEQLKNLISKTIMNFYNDLFLQDEHKDRLYTFAIKIASFLKFTAAVVSSEGNNNSLQQDFSCLKELLNPNLKKHTEAKGIHNTIEMTAFLKILGRQLIQININAENTPMICLAIKTDGRRIEYINITEEAEESTSIEINLQLEQLIRNKRAPQIGPKTLSNVLADNKGFGKKINLFRLFTAIGYEALAYKISQLH